MTTKYVEEYISPSSIFGPTLSFFACWIISSCNTIPKHLFNILPIMESPRSKAGIKVEETPRVSYYNAPTWPSTVRKTSECQGSFLMPSANQADPDILGGIRVAKEGPCIHHRCGYQPDTLHHIIRKHSLLLISIDKNHQRLPITNFRLNSYPANETCLPKVRVLGQCF